MLSCVHVAPSCMTKSVQAWPRVLPIMMIHDEHADGHGRLLRVL